MLGESEIKRPPNDDTAADDRVSRELLIHLRFWAAVLVVGAVLGVSMWCYLAIRIAFFSAID
jgi:hypothetical protein